MKGKIEGRRHVLPLVRYRLRYIGDAIDTRDVAILPDRQFLGAHGRQRLFAGRAGKTKRSGARPPRESMTGQASQVLENGAHEIYL